MGFVLWNAIAFCGFSTRLGAAMALLSDYIDELGHSAIVSPLFVCGCFGGYFLFLVSLPFFWRSVPNRVERATRTAYCATGSEEAPALKK